jgi:hypothetical protein
MDKLVKYKKGFATLEVVIAISIIALAISGSILVSFLNQSITIDSQSSRQALNIAKELLEAEENKSRLDFTSLKNISPQTFGIYEKSISIISPTSTDRFFSKTIKATVTWKNEILRPQKIELYKRITNFNRDSDDTCNSYLTGNWSNPNMVSYNFKNLIGVSSGIYPITSIDAFMSKLYVTTSNSSANQKTLFVFDISNPTNPILISGIDNDPNNPGPNDIVVTSSSAGNFAFLASGSSFFRGQLQIVNLDTIPFTFTNYKIPTSIVPTAGLGKSIYYKDGFVYLGLTSSPGGDEFNIIDVHTPNSPIWVGGVGLNNHGVNDLFVKDQFTFIARPTDNSDLIQEELTLIDSTNSSIPFRSGGYNAPDNQGHGKSLDIVKDKIYLGRTVTSVNSEFVILDNSNPTSGNFPLIASKEISSSVNALKIRDYVAFLLTNTQFLILNISDLSNITQLATPIALPSSSSGIAMDCEDNYFYIGSNDSTNNGFLTIITAS